MGASSGFPIDLILFGMIAAFLVLRLRSILGRRTGFERQAPPPQPVGQQPATGPVIDGHAEWLVVVAVMAVLSLVNPARVACQTTTPAGSPTISQPEPAPDRPSRSQPSPA